MKRVGELDTDLIDPEVQAAVDEVCGALADPWGSPSGLGERFGFALYQAAKYGDPACRAAIFEAVESGVRGDPDIWMAASGHIFTRADIGRYEGKLDYERDENGVMRQLLKWPTGHYANGNPAYERREDAA